MNKSKKIFITSLMGFSLIGPLALQNSNVVSAKTEVYGKAPTKGAEKNGFEEAEKANNEAIPKLQKQSDKFYKTHDKNIEYDLDGSIPKDPNNIAVAKKYKKELPNLEKQLKSLKQGTKKYKTLNHEIQLHKTAIKAIFG